MYLKKTFELIDRQIEFTGKCMLSELAIVNCPFKAKSETKLKWTGSIVDWVELIYSLHVAGIINDGKVTLKKLFCTMGEFFDFDVKEFSNYFMNIKRRVKGDRTTFLDRLKGGLQDRMEEADRKPTRK